MTALREVLKLARALMDGQPIFITFAWAIQKGRPVYCPFTISLNLPEHLKITTFLGSSIKSSPVAGFLPLRAFFFFTQNLPNPDTNPSSADVRVF